MTDQPTSNRPQRGASPAQDADRARELADEAYRTDRPDLAVIGAVYAQLAQASLLSAILRELRFANDPPEDAR